MGIGRENGFDYDLKKLQQVQRAKWTACVLVSYILLFGANNKFVVAPLKAWF